jgi:hypothetical protein
VGSRLQFVEEDREVEDDDAERHRREPAGRDVVAQGDQRTALIAAG